MSSQPKQVFHLPQSPSESLLEVRGAFPGSQAALGRCYSARVFIVNAGSESAGRGTVAPTDAGAVCHQRRLQQVRPLRGHSPRPGARTGRAALLALLPGSSHPWDQTLWATHALSPIPTHKDGQVILGLVPGGRQFTPSHTCGGGTPPTQRPRAHHGGAGDPGGWRSLGGRHPHRLTW